MTQQVNPRLGASQCPVCQGQGFPLDVVDFNKNCEEQRGKFLPLSGVPIYYFLCERCNFCFAPEFARWSFNDFSQRIYNDQYLLVDPDYIESRPRANAALINNMFGEQRTSIRHLDYGGGKGLLSAVLRESGWQSKSYDPFVDDPATRATLGKFNLITAFEVFEHVPDVRQLVHELSTMLDPAGLIIFSTLISDEHLAPRKRMTWWYAAPRNGHVSLFSKKSLNVLGSLAGFQFASQSAGLHAFYRQLRRSAGGGWQF